MLFVMFSSDFVLSIISVVLSASNVVVVVPSVIVLLGFVVVVVVAAGLVEFLGPEVVVSRPFSPTDFVVEPFEEVLVKRSSLFIVVELSTSPVVVLLLLLLNVVGDTVSNAVLPVLPSASFEVGVELSVN